MYREKMPDWLKHFDFIIIDIISLELSFAIAYIIRHGISSISTELPDLYINVALVLMFLDIIETVFFRGFTNIVIRGYYKEFRETLKHATIIAFLLVLYMYLIKQGVEYSRTVYIITWELDIIITYFAREFWKWVIKNSHKHSQVGKAFLVIITTSDLAQDIAGSLIKKERMRFNIRGFILLDRNMVGQKIAGIEIVAGSEDALDYICRDWVDEVFISLPEKDSALEEEIINNCVLMGITVHRKIAKVISTPGCVQFVSNISDYTVLSSSVGIVTVRQMILKRFMDIVGGLFGMVITCILFIFIAPIIYIKSPGPILFKQWRVGRNGKKFQIYKFRSMYLDAEERKAELMEKNKVKDGMMFKIENDPRIIGGENGKGIGNFIRRTSIDEFPQFFNVLKGDMSLGGTRPPTLDEWKKYKL
ncbi:MAG: sugar transferase, partial [Lachnospiraceae bacterium]|nr:sugar transferase [Lachnospiraceae bacterium]